MFCFCELKRQNYNSEICTECLANPLEINAVQQLSVYNQCINCDKFLCSFHLDRKFIDVDLCPQCYYTQNSNYSFYDPEDDFDDGVNFTDTQIYRNYDSRQLNHARDLEEDNDENEEIHGEAAMESDEDDDSNRAANDDEDEDENENDVNERYNVTFFNQMHRYYESQQQRESDAENMDLSDQPDYENENGEQTTTWGSGGSGVATGYNKSGGGLPIHPTIMTDDEMTELYDDKRACPICLEVLAGERFTETRLGLGLLALATACVTVILPCDQETVTTPSTQVLTTVETPGNATVMVAGQADDCFILSQQRACVNAISVQTTTEQVHESTKPPHSDKTTCTPPSLTRPHINGTSLRANTKCGIRQCWSEVPMSHVVDVPVERKLPLTRLQCHKTHIFHSKCIDQWLKNKNACPLCCRRVAVL